MASNLKSVKRRMRKLEFSCASVCIFSLLTLEGMAATYTGRATVGGFISREHFSLESDGTYNNDFATFSSRLYTRYSDLEDSHFEATLDLRDKHDFFEKYDAERLALTGKNTPQLRQLSLKYANQNSPFIATAGRFPITDAGAVNIDGLDAGFKWNSDWKSLVFAGHDPKLPNQTYFQQNPGAYAYGAYTVYQPVISSWRKSVLNSTAFVIKKVDQHIDRKYFYDFFLYEWDSPNRIIGMLYLDFVPKTIMQTGMISYDQKIQDNWMTNLQFLGIDTIEYSRRRGILETLAPSPYKELSFSLRQNLNASASLQFFSMYGKRYADQKTIQELSFGPELSQMWHKEISGSFKFGYRKNFTSNDYFSKINLGYYPKNWEFVLDESLAIQKSTTTEHPIITEFSVSHFISRALYATASAQNAVSEIANIYSFSLFIGYRFGSKDVPPLRDGAPPRGRI